MVLWSETPQPWLASFRSMGELSRSFYPLARARSRCPDVQNGDRITVQWLGTVCHWWKPRGGPNLDATPNDIIRRIECYSGVKLAEAFAIPDLDREVKWHCRYARQNGIHVSPTFMIDELVQTDMSSGDPVADWVSRLLS